MPTALLRFLMSRIGPLLQRAAKATPGLEARLATALRTAGAQAGSTVASITAFARANPINMALLVTTLGSVGYDMVSFFSGAPKDAESKEFIRNVSSATASSNANVPAIVARGSTIRDVADRTVSHSPGLAARADDLATMSAATQWAVDFFGSRANAENGLNYLDFLLNVNSADREAAFRYLRTR